MYCRRLTAVSLLGLTAFLSANSVLAFNKGIVLDPVDVGPGCTYSSIQTAINNGFSEIRVVNGVYTEDIDIFNENITIRGGYASCSNASNGIINIDAGPNSVTIASDNNPTVSVSGAINSRTVNLENVTITNDGGIFPGRGLAISGDNFVFLSSVRVTDNSSFASGGGIYLSGADAELSMIDTQVDTNNVAIPLRNSALKGGAPTGGGGIYCEDGNVHW